jgi:hypothetical protein
MDLTIAPTEVATIIAQPSPSKTFLTPQSIVDLSKFRKEIALKGTESGAAFAVNVPLSTLRSRRDMLQKAFGPELAKNLESPELMHEIVKMLYVALIEFAVYGGMGISTFVRFIKSTFLGELFPTSESYWLGRKDEINRVINDRAATKFGELSKDLEMNRDQITAILDEVFFSGKPVLVIVEASSRFVFSQSLRENRKTEEWLDVATKSMGPLIKNLHSMVVDRGQALAALARKLGIPVTTDLFHVIHAIFSAFILSLNRRINTLRKEIVKLEKKEQTEGIIREINEFRSQHAASEKNLEVLHEIVKEINSAYSPCDLYTGKMRTDEEIVRAIDAAFDRLSQFSDGITMTENERKQLKKALNARELMKSAVLFYTNYVRDILASTVDSDDDRSLIEQELLPIEILRIQSKRKGERDKSALCQRVAELESELCVRNVDRVKDGSLEYLIEIARALAALWVRSSSAVEGHNGWLSRIMHAARVFSQTAMDANMSVKNYLVPGRDGKTPAERLFKVSCRAEFLDEVLRELKPMAIRIGSACVITQAR